MQSGHETDLSEGQGQKPKRQQRLTDVPNMKRFYRALIFPLFHLLSSNNDVFMGLLIYFISEIQFLFIDI